MTTKPTNMHNIKENVNFIRTQIECGNTKDALQLLDKLLKAPCNCADELYYLKGNAYRKEGNWQMALNNYLEAIDLNPESPAVHAREMIMNILEFYNKDMYNQ